MYADETICRDGARSAFTLIEMLVVIAVIAALAAIGIPTLDYMRHRGYVAATESLVKDVAMVIATHQDQHLTLQVGGRLQVYQLWDVNGDGILDGDPALEDPTLDVGDRYPAAVLAADSGYSGFIKDVKPTLPERHVDELWRVIDSWGYPLRIDYAADTYGAAGFGVWSVGADGISDPLASTRDDICAWEISGE